MGVVQLESTDMATVNSSVLKRQSVGVVQWAWSVGIVQ